MVLSRKLAVSHCFSGKVSKIGTFLGEIGAFMGGTAVNMGRIALHNRSYGWLLGFR